MDNKKNLLLAIVLSVVIIVLWNIFLPSPQIKKSETPPAPQQATPTTTTNNKPLTIESRDQAIGKTARVTIDSPKLKGSINLRGLRFDDLNLAAYATGLDTNTPPITLLSPSNTEHGYVVDIGWLVRDPKLATPNSDTLWSANKKTLTAGDSVTFNTSLSGINYRVLVALDNNYLFTITATASNFSRINQDMAFYGLVARFGNPVVSDLSILHEGAIGMLGNKLLEVSYKKLQKKETRAESPNGWLGFTDKYWLTALSPLLDNKPATTTTVAIPPANFASRFSFDNSTGINRYQADFTTPYETLTRKQPLEKTLYLFAGPKETGLINDYSKNKNIHRFDLAIDYGYLYILTKPFAWLLHFFSNLFNSVGMAILALTVIVRLVLFPLAQKSFHSMAMMKKLGPEINTIKKRYSNNNTEMSKAMMALYKKEGVNPLAGCLPMLIQIPVFFALYKVFIISIEFRHAPFFGWIHDLSSPDPLGLLTLFGLIPWSVPHFLGVLNIGLWPIIMGLTLWLQQQFNPPAADPIQAKIFKFFPFLFTFLLGQSPAGLVIYWSWNNALSILQQYIINRQLGITTVPPFLSHVFSKKRS